MNRKVHNSQSHHHKEEQCWSITLPDFNLYYKIVLTNFEYNIGINTDTEITGTEETVQKQTHTYMVN